MTNQEMVHQLHMGLKPLEMDETIAEAICSVYGDFDWSFDWNEFEMSFCQSLGDYLLVRGCVVNLNAMVYYEKDGQEFCVRASEFDSMVTGLPDDEYEGLEDSSMGDLEPEFEGEFFRTFINLKTGDITQYELQTDDGHNNVVGKNWVLLDHEKHETCYYHDLDIHPMLAAVGYKRMVADESLDYMWNHSFSQFIQSLIQDPNIQYIYKNLGFYGLEHINGQDGDIYKTALKIARRHKYEITDAYTWFSYISLLDTMSKDIHNPHFVCPTNLQYTYETMQAEYKAKEKRIKEKKDRLLRKALEEQAKRDMEHIDTILANEHESCKAYTEHMSPYFDISITGGNMIIAPLKSVAEFYEEGLTMNHCVFRNGYYKRFTSLILSCRRADGYRVATIEVNLTNMEIVQIQGFKDDREFQNTYEHEQIHQLITDNLRSIYKIRRSLAA